MRSGSLRTRRNIGRRNTRGWRRQKGDGMLRKAEEANDSYSVLNLVAYLLPLAIHSVGGTVDVEDSWTQLTSTDIIQTRLSVLQVCSTRKDHLSNLCCFCCCCCHSGFLLVRWKGVASFGPWKEVWSCGGHINELEPSNNAPDDPSEWPFKC